MTGKTTGCKRITGRGAASCLALAATVLAFGTAIPSATAGPNVSLSSTADLSNLTVGELVPISVSLSGLQVGADFIFNLDTKVLFTGSLLTPVADPGNSSGLTPGAGFFFDPSQTANFNAASSLGAGEATGDFSDANPNGSFAINENGVYYTFTVRAAAAGSGSISFDPSPGANEYAADDTGFNPAPLPTGSPLNFTVRAAVTAAPEPSSVAAFAFTGLGAAGLMLRARKRRTLA